MANSKKAEQVMIDYVRGGQVAEVKVSYSHKVPAKERFQVSTSEGSYEVMKKYWPNEGIEYNETFVILLLNRSNKVLGLTKISEGGISGTVADPKMIFQAALKANASSIILGHNHPSGNLKPSGADIALTNKMKEAGKFLDLPILDHLIVTSCDGYFSFADEGIL